MKVGTGQSFDFDLRSSHWWHWWTICILTHLDTATLWFLFRSVHQRQGFFVAISLGYLLFPKSLCGVLVFDSVSHLCHTPSFTHHFVTHHLSHPTLSHTIFHTPLCHPPSFTHNFVTHHLLPHHLSHTTLSHTIFDTPSFTHHFVTHHLSHATLSHTQLCFTSRSRTTSFVFSSFPVPGTTCGAHYWKKLPCGVIRSFNFLSWRKQWYHWVSCWYNLGMR